MENNWKETWKYSYPYDLLEIYGEIDQNLGYAYAYENRRNNILSMIKEIAQTGDKILDVAAAQGNFSLKLAEMGYDVTWNDIRADLAEYVEMKKESGKITYQAGNIFDSKFQGFFDIILASEIIEHVAHPDEFLKNLSKLVKIGGHIVISTPLGSYFRNNLPKFSEFSDPSIFESKQFGPNSEDHIFLLYMDEIEGLAQKSGLKVKNIKYYTNPLTTGHIKLQKLLRVMPKSIVFNIEKLTQRLPVLIGKRIHNSFSVLFEKSVDSKNPVILSNDF